MDSRVDKFCMGRGRGISRRRRYYQSGNCGLLRGGGREKLPVINEEAEGQEGMIPCFGAIVDLGWLCANRQVGSPGKTASPVIYLALGSSGQRNHVAGKDKGLPLP